MEKNVKKVNILIISAFGLQAELPASKRIYDLLTGFARLNFPVKLITPELPFLTKNPIPNENLLVVKKGAIQTISEVIIDGMINIINYLNSIGRRNDSTKKEKAPLKPIYLSPGKLLQYYLFFFYSKRALPLFRIFREATKIINEPINDNPFVILTSSAPGSMHLIGYFLQKKFKRKVIWIADFQDPLENSELLGIKSNFLYSITDKVVFKNANLICYPSPTLFHILNRTAQEHGLDIQEKLYFLPFAINTPTFKEMKPGKIDEKRDITVFYAGTIYKEMEEPLRSFFKALKKSKTFKFIYAGYTSEIVKKLLNELNLDLQLVKIHDILPKNLVFDFYEKSDILLNLVSFGKSLRVPGSKFFELLATDKPILMIAPNGADYLDLAKEAGGVWISSSDPDEILKNLNEIRHEVMNKKKTSFRNKKVLEKFAPEVIARKLLEKLNLIA